MTVLNFINFIYEKYNGKRLFNQFGLETLFLFELLITVGMITNVLGGLH